MTEWSQLTLAQIEGTPVPSKDKWRAHMRNSTAHLQLPPAMGRGVLWTHQRLRSLPSFSPLPISVSPTLATPSSIIHCLLSSINMCAQDYFKVLLLESFLILPLPPVRHLSIR